MALWLVQVLYLVLFLCFLCVSYHNVRMPCVCCSYNSGQRADLQKVQHHYRVRLYTCSGQGPAALLTLVGTFVSSPFEVSSRRKLKKRTARAVVAEATGTPSVRKKKPKLEKSTQQGFIRNIGFRQPVSAPSLLPLAAANSWVPYGISGKSLAGVQQNWGLGSLATMVQSRGTVVTGAQTQPSVNPQVQAQMWAQMQAHTQAQIQVHMHMQALLQAQLQEQMHAQEQMQPLLENGQRAREVEEPCGHSDNSATPSSTSSHLPCLRDILGSISSRSTSTSSSASPVSRTASPHANVTSQQAADLMLHFSTLSSKSSCNDSCTTNNGTTSPHAVVVSSEKHSFPSLERVIEPD